MWKALLAGAVVAVLVGFYLAPNLSKPKTHVSSTAQRTVVVVGGGLAGLSAAIEAAKAGSKVVLIEKQGKLTGNSAKASSGINAAVTPQQDALEIVDSEETFFNDTFLSGRGKADKAKVDILVHESKNAIQFLTDAGCNLDLLSQCGGHSVPRTHRNYVAPDTRPVNVGWHIISTLSKSLEKYAENVTILTSTSVVELITDPTLNDAVVGVTVRESDDKPERDIAADAVVLATGGYSADRGRLLEEFRKDYTHLPTTNGAFATGDGAHLGREIGAILHQMDYVQLHPTGIVDPSKPESLTLLLAPEALRGLGGLLLNRKGQRFVNEVGYRDDVTAKIREQHDTFKPWSTTEDVKSTADIEVAYLVLNDEVAEAFGTATLGFYRSRGIVTTVPDAAGLAALLGLDDANVLKQTFAEYQAIAESGSPGKITDDYGKTRFPVIFSPDEQLHVIMVTPVIHYCMGGLKTSPEGHVLRANNARIDGLYAAGEVASGTHGANRLAGNSLAECVVFGRLAGQLASTSN